MADLNMAGKVTIIQIPNSFHPVSEACRVCVCEILASERASVCLCERDLSGSVREISASERASVCV